MGDESGEAVVISEPQLRRRHSIILVDDGNDAEGEELLERQPSISVVIAADDIVRGEEDLADADPPVLELLRVSAHEVRLADHGRCLEARHIART